MQQAALQTKMRDCHWIEAEDFARSDFAAHEAANRAALNEMAMTEASGGRLVVAFQRSGNYLEYEFREDIDGLWHYDVWLRYATTCPFSRLAVSCNQAEAGDAVLDESGDFFRKFNWRKLAAIRVPKGRHVLRLTLKTGVIHPDLIVMYPAGAALPLEEIEGKINQPGRLVNAPEAPLNRNRLWVQHDRNGVPLGGLGTGKVELCQDGGFANVSINNNQDAPIATLPGAFFIVRERTPAGATVRFLEHTNRPGPLVETLRYEGRFPFANLVYEDCALATRLSLEAFSPLIPYDVRRSSIPAALFRFTAENPSDRDVELAIGFSWENAIGCGGLGQKPQFGPGTALAVEGESFHAWQDRSGNDQRPIRTAQGTGLEFFAATDHGYGSSYGKYAVLAANAPGIEITTTRSYNVEEHIPEIVNRLPDGIPTELLTTPGREGVVHPAGIVWASCRLRAGAKEQLIFCLAWHFPHYLNPQGRAGSFYYTNHFGSASAAADVCLEQGDVLAADSREVNDLVARSSLPDWMKQKIVNDLFPLVTCTWFQKDGRFSVNEAPSKMHGCLGTIDQRTASQGVYTALFPDLDRVELGLFAEYQHANGMISHDLGHGSIDPELLNFNQWPDLACSFIIQSLRHVQATGDLDFGRQLYGHVPAAIAWVVSLDDDRDGVPDMKAGRGSTYDSSEWPGCSAFTATMWIAGLRAAAELARLVGRAEDAGEYLRLAERAAQTMERKLWNGIFYRNFYCEDTARTDGENCLLPQVAGEWALCLLGLSPGLPQSRIVAALREVFRRNIVGRNIQFKGPVDETTPTGDPAGVGTAFLQYAWVYFGALAAYCGLTEEALYCWEQSYRQTWEINRQPWKTRLCGYAVTGRFNGLPWYMTNTASWDILQALSGFAYSIPERWLRVEPHLPESWRDGKDCLRLRVPLFGARFWLWLDYSETRDSRVFVLTSLRQGPSAMSFNTFTTTLPPGVALKAISVNGHAHSEWTYDQPTGRLTISLDAWSPSMVIEVETDVVTVRKCTVSPAAN